MPEPSQTTVSIESHHHPLFLSVNDDPSLVLISKKLVGSSNYSTWKRSMHVALSTRNKLQLIDGKYPKPPPGDPLTPRWEQANAMVMCWILNTVSESIYNSLVFAETAHKMWSDLEEIYGTPDGLRYFQLEKSINGLKQRGNSIQTYYQELKGVWDEMDAMEAPSLCHCPCTCSVGRSLENREQRRRLMIFLMGLNESYTAIRGQLLMMNPPPTVSQAYGMISREERQRQGYIPRTSVQFKNNSNLTKVRQSNNGKYVPGAIQVSAVNMEPSQLNSEFEDAYQTKVDTMQNQLNQLIAIMQERFPSAVKVHKSNRCDAAPAKDSLTSSKQSPQPVDAPSEHQTETDLNLSAKLYSALRSLRTSLVEEAGEGVMGYHIFGNATLQNISKRIPKTREELLEINGVSRAKVNKYGDRVLQTIEATLNEHYKIDKNSSSGDSTTDSAKRRRDEDDFIASTGDLRDEADFIASTARSKKRLSKKPVPSAEVVDYFDKIADEDLDFDDSLYYADVNASNSKINRIM